jgi:hypothetical protein
MGETADPLANDIKGAFGVAFVRAVAHAAGCFAQEANRDLDGDGVDLTIFHRTKKGSTRSSRLDLQVKTTEHQPEGDPLPFDLPAKNYDELRADSYQVPRILVVVQVPELRADWLSTTDESVILRHRAYWLSLVNAAESDNEFTVRVRIPRSQRLDVAGLQGIMGSIAQRRLP